MKQLFLHPAQIVTINTNGLNYKRGADMNNIGLLYNHSIYTEDGIIKDIIPDSSIHKYTAHIKHILEGKTILPGFIDCHTHTVFAGSRADEFRLKLKGATYEDIAKAGGGINKTVEAIRSSDKQYLFKLAKKRIEDFIKQGLTTIEIKSGYGLDFENEIKILETIKELKENLPVEIIPTFLGAHTYPKEYKSDHRKYLDIIINEMLPYIAEHRLAYFCDAFCETTAFSAEETDEVFSKAKSLGLKLKLHSEQFNNIGGVDIGFKHNAFSIDHLEVLKTDDFKKFGATETAAVLLPGVPFFLKYGYAPARELINNNAIVALSSDYNPGSSHINNLSILMGIAALNMKMSIEEILSAFTINAAKALGISESTGSIEPGKQADFAVLDTEDFSDIVYNTGSNLNIMTIKNGNIIYKQQ